MFTEADRHIFSFHDGQQQVFADPLELERRISAAFEGEDQNALVEQYNSEVPAQKLEGAVKLAAKIRIAFELEPFSKATGQGATVATCIRVWNDYQDFVTQKKTPSANGATSLSLSESTSSPDPSTTEPIAA